MSLRLRRLNQVKRGEWQCRHSRRKFPHQPHHNLLIQRCKAGQPIRSHLGQLLPQEQKQGISHQEPRLALIQ